MIIELERDDVVRFSKLRGARLTCLAGALWITADSDPNDMALQGGESHVICRNGTLVQALRRSRLVVQPARQRSQWLERCLADLIPA